MWLEFTPKDLLMMRVGVIFCEGDPDPEDGWVRSYLAEHQLVPRHQVSEERNGVRCDSLYFGQCYLGRHLHALQALYHRGLERSILMEKLRELRRAPDHAAVSWPHELDDNSFESYLPRLAEALHEQAGFSTDSEGYMTVSLAPDRIAAELTRLLDSTPATP